MKIVHTQTLCAGEKTGKIEVVEEREVKREYWEKVLKSAHAMSKPATLPATLGSGQTSKRSQLRKNNSSVRQMLGLIPHCNAKCKWRRGCTIFFPDDTTLTASLMELAVYFALRNRQTLLSISNLNIFRYKLYYLDFVLRTKLFRGKPYFFHYFAKFHHSGYVIGNLSSRRSFQESERPICTT